MAMTLTVDGLDLSAYIRVAPGEGVDPFDADMLEPGFTDSAGLEGPELLAQLAGAREMVWPLHVTPLKTAAYADTKQGLHDQLRDLNSLLAQVTKRKGRLLVWQDEGADNSTSYDILAARFESDYNFRRGQKLWASGILRVWTKPYGHRGSHRALTAASTHGTGVAVSLAVPQADINGDMPAMLEAVVTGGSYNMESSVRALGIAVVPSGYTHDVPAASFIPLLPFAVSGDVSLASFGATAALGSYTRYMAEVNKVDVFTVPFSPASMYEGRQRVFGVVRGTDQVVLEDDSGQVIGRAQASVPLYRNGFQAVDLGVVDIRPQPGQATVTLRLGVDLPDVPPNDYLIANRGVEFNRLLIYPEDALALAVDSSRRLVSHLTWLTARDELSTDLAAAPSATYGGTVSLDSLGIDANASYVDQWAAAPWSPVATVGILQGFTSAATAAVQFAARIDAPLTDVETHIPIRRFMGSGAVIAAGKWVNDGVSNPGVAAGLFRLVSTAAGALSVHTQSGASLMASVAVNIAATSSIILRVRSRGPVMEASLRTSVGSLIASIAASNVHFGMEGRAWVGGIGSQGQVHIWGWTIEEIASVGYAARDQLVFAGASNMVLHQTAGSAFQRDASKFMVGRIPQLSPSIPQQIVGIQLGIDGYTRPADALSLNVRVLERWRYAR